jgi:hypothetical protein
MQTELAIHRATNGRLPPLRMLDQGAALDPQGECATVGLSLPAFLGLETMQLPVMPDERSNANQPFVIGRTTSPDRARRQHPGVYAMGFPDLCQLFARFLEAPLIPQGFGFVALLCLDGCKLAKFCVEPLLAYFQGGKTLIPSLFTTCAALMSSTTKILIGKSLQRKEARRSFHCQRALVEGGSFFLL